MLRCRPLGQCGADSTCQVQQNRESSNLGKHAASIPDSDMPVVQKTLHQMLLLLNAPNMVAKECDAQIDAVHSQGLE